MKDHVREVQLNQIAELLVGLLSRPFHPELDDAYVNGKLRDMLVDLVGLADRLGMKLADHRIAPDFPVQTYNTHVGAYRG